MEAWRGGEYQVSSFDQYFTHYYFRYVILALLTLPVALLKQVIVYSAGMSGAPNLSESILDILCIRSGWGLSKSNPYNGPMWFIDVLLMMYMVFWVIVKVSKGDKGKVCLGCGMMTIVGLFILSSKTEFFIFDDRYAGRGLASFFLGCIIYEIFLGIEISTQSKRRRIVAILILFVCIFGLPYFTGNDMVKSIYGSNYIFIYILMVFPCVVILFAMLSFENSIVQKISKIIGAFSTSLFIWHYPILVSIWGMDVLSGGIINRVSIKTFILVTVMCFGWALFSSKYIEKKLLSILKKREKKDL